MTKMKFGDYIRELRQSLRWTQPEAASQIGIEQSYLSKLESGKSYPSEDVFSGLISAYSIDLSKMNVELFPGELDKLREIGEVRAVILREEQDKKRLIRAWLIVGICALMMGGALLGLTQLARDTTVAQFQYRSEGVILAGESFDVFEIIGDSQLGFSSDAEIFLKRQQEMIARIDEQYQSLPDNRGVTFFEPVPNGTRVWRFFGINSETVKSPLRWLIAPAFMFILGGLGCFFVSYRWR